MRITILILVFITGFGYSQTLEFGPNFSYGYTNIVNSTINQGRAVIGNNLWSFNNGFSVLYNFNNRKYENSSAIHFEYSTNERGSLSEVYSNSRYYVKANSYNLNYRYSGAFNNGYLGVYADLGIGYNTFLSDYFYYGKVDELDAFERVKNKFEIKESEVCFLYSLGVDKLIFNNKVVVFFELNGDAAISKIDFNGSHRTQSLGFSTGFRYRYDFKKNK
jgi:hypothetical protein